MDIVLAGGLWLDGTAWDQVVPELRALGHRGIPVLLPGQGDGANGATLADQAAAVVEAIDTATAPVAVVGHSAACTLAWIGADRRPDAVSRVILIGGFPKADGDTYADYFEIVDGAMPFPGWEPFDGPDTADFDDALRDRVAAAAVPVPEGVSRGTVELSDDRRFDVPVTIVCPEFGPDDARGWVAGGDVPELSKARSVEYVDIDTGHWPMFTAPALLARVLADAVSR
ncbi:alpha/beta fold hydrolase [Desertimonas flava]|uniref:alpha/beta fold hydrolase n=1 Tax=Desertimonas flava TaxID=2064846 RepID=UPI000E35774D|nr:alpha/beta hydrolase [Desertimonas flava]